MEPGSLGESLNQVNLNPSTYLNAGLSSVSAQPGLTNLQVPQSEGVPATEEKKEKAKESFATGAWRRFDQAGDSFVASVVTAVPRFLGAAVLTALAVPAGIAGLTVSVISLFTGNANGAALGRNLRQFSRDSYGVGLSTMLFTPVDLVMSTVRFLTSWAISPEIKVKKGLVKTSKDKVDNTPNDVMKHVHKVVVGLTFAPVYITTFRAQVKSLRLGPEGYPLLNRVKNLFIHGSPKTPEELKRKDSTVRNFLQGNYQDIVRFAMQNIFTKKDHL